MAVAAAAAAPEANTILWCHGLNLGRNAQGWTQAQLRVCAFLGESSVLGFGSETSHVVQPSPRGALTHTALHQGLANFLEKSQ